MTSGIPIFRTVASLRKWRQSLPHDSTIGFVPTMGALHEGHLSLVTASKAENSHTVVSIFVNPSQFAPHEDLDAYPRTFDHDLSKLGENGGVDALFAPTITEMYPSGITLEVEKQKGAFVSVLGLSEQLEGKTRPNFFRGVATVVTKLFNVVDADRAYFGQKDIQQTVVLKRMVKDLLMRVEIRVLPIIREDTGLAMSSRNVYLGEEVRDNSKKIYESLLQGKKIYEAGEKRAQTIIETVKSGLNDELFKIDYVSIADKEELQELETINENGAILSIAVYVTEGDRTTRLIDNIIL